ncbi:hypothetical protein ECE50_012400 [Chitinophaga sp. Mgbs1]|uniref:Uncharacterized protein n=1 Tax=Chitinophaga solisilvae TaxID=1233460 RepID=A0A9Q5D444_9BACT|nr:hypothetical protein [Chitinophaga solisilvae]
MMKYTPSLLLILCLFSTAIKAQQPRIGLGTKSPRGTWDINGDVYTKNKLFADNMAVAQESVGSLGILPTGEIVKIATVNNASTINLITYNLNNVSKTKISDYDTKIDTSRYIIALVGLVFNKFVRLPQVNNTNVVPPITARVFPTATKTWHLALDYNGATTDDNTNGNWKVQVLVISKSIAEIYPLISVPFKGGTTGTASPPADM